MELEEALELLAQAQAQLADGDAQSQELAAEIDAALGPVTPIYQPVEILSPKEHAGMKGRQVIDPDGHYVMRVELDDGKVLDGEFSYRGIDA